MRVMDLTNESKIVKVVITKNTKEKFILQYVDARAQIAYTFGYVIHYRGHTMTHEPGWKSFRVADVVVDYVHLTVDFVQELFSQTVRHRRESGHILVKAGAKTYDMGPGLASTKGINSRLDRFKNSPPPVIDFIPRLRKVASS